MVEIEYIPLQKIVIHDIELSPSKVFVNHAVARGGTVGWCNGFLFSLVHFPSDPDLIKDSIKGIQHWQTIEVAVHPEFESVVKNDDNQGIQVLDQSHNEVIAAAIVKVKEVLKLE